MIKLKQGVMEHELWRLDRRLWDMIGEIHTIAQNYGGHDVVLTSILRPKDYQSPHAYGRAVDIRTRDWPKQLIQAIVDHLNAKYVRDDRKPTAIYHDVGRGPHLHIQVPAPYESPTAPGRRLPWGDLPVVT